MEEDTPAELAVGCAAGSPEGQLTLDLAIRSFLHQQRQTLHVWGISDQFLRAPKAYSGCTHPTRRSCARRCAADHTLLS